jgi:hypothetical protein
MNVTPTKAAADEQQPGNVQKCFTAETFLHHDNHNTPATRLTEFVIRANTNAQHNSKSNLYRHLTLTHHTNQPIIV